MNANLDELLREGMLRFTADLHAPANLADRARRHRSQRLTLRTAAASAAAAIAIAAIAVGAVSARTARQPNLNRPAGPVERSDVEYLRLTGSLPAKSETIWSYGRTSRQLITSLSGRLLEDDGYSVIRYVHGRFTLTRTIVEFSSKTWARARVGPFATSARVAPTCAQPELGWPGSPVSLPSWIRNLHKAMDCGDLAIAGVARIEGVEAIKLAATSKLRKSPVSVTTIWIKRANDVPLRMAGGDVRDRWRADISWLRPTKTNLALLQVPIPDGFRRVGIGDFPNAILPPVAGCHKDPSNRYVEDCTAVAYSLG